MSKTNQIYFKGRSLNDEIWTMSKTYTESRFWCSEDNALVSYSGASRERWTMVPHRSNMMCHSHELTEVSSFIRDISGNPADWKDKLPGSGKNQTPHVIAVI